MAEVNLSDLFTAISQAMLDAHQAVTRSTLDQYWDYFRPSRLPRDGRMASAGEMEDALVPVTRKVVIPTPDGNGVFSELSVPLVTLVHHNTFSLDQVKLRMRVSASVDQAGGPLKVSLAPLRRQNHRGTADDAPDTAGQSEEPDQEIELVFKREAPAEGISRITTEAVKLL